MCVCVCSWVTGWPTSFAAEQPLSEAAESIMLFKGLVHVSMPWTPGSASYCDTKGSSTETTINTGAQALGLKIQPVMLPGETEPHWALGCCEVTATKACKSHCLRDLCPSDTNHCVWKPQKIFKMVETATVSKQELWTSWLMYNNLGNHAYRDGYRRDTVLLNLLLL